MSRVTRCQQCGGNVVEPAFEGDGAYPIEPMCRCSHNQPNPRERLRWPSQEPHQ